VRAPEPVHGKTSVLQHNGTHPLFAGMPHTFEVMRYHSLVLESLDDTPLDCLATTSDGQVMALAHRELPLTGVQFHPESILTEHGLQLLRNWIDSIKSD
jgi:anthranilate/para-aminobenzoate synthase component II